jgi:hypothetical protein
MNKQTTLSHNFRTIETWELLEHLCLDFNQDPYPDDTLIGEGVYYRPDSIVEHTHLLYVFNESDNTQ